MITIKDLKDRIKNIPDHWIVNLSIVSNVDSYEAERIVSVYNDKDKAMINIIMTSTKN